MVTIAQSQSVLRFDGFEVDLHACELRKHGTRIKLQDQPFQVLCVLLEHHGETVGREELKQKLWPADTFVDFDDGLNTAIKKLRDTLGDSADRPRYIETIPRHGYRFIGAVEHQESIGTGAPQKNNDEVEAAPRLIFGKRAVLLYWVVLVSAITLAVLGASTWIYRGHSQREAASIHSIAVLPLENLSGDASQDYFAAGITDALTTELARTVGSSMRVASRTSAAKYKDKALAQIANELDVDAVIEGSVIKSGDHARIMAQLINARADKHLWAASYDRDLRDMLGLQSEIAATIARQVQITLSPRAQARLSAALPANPQAYDLYQRGRYHAFSRNRQDLAGSIELLQQAVRLDPNLADAHAVLARAYIAEAFSLAPTGEGEDLEIKAMDEVNRALKLDPDLADGYLTRANIYWTHRNGFPHERAILEVNRALELDPNSAEAHHHLGMIYLHIGLLDKAERELSAALHLDPTNLGVRYRIAIVQLDQGRLEEAKRGLEGTRAFIPELWSYQMALALYKLDRKQEAAALIREYLRQNPRDEGGVGNAIQALLYADAGHRALAERSIRSAVQKGKDFGHFHHAAYTIGSAYALMNRPKDAVRWLRAAAEDGFPCYPLYEHDTALQNIRSDPGFLELMSQMRNDWERRKATL